MTNQHESNAQNWSAAECVAEVVRQVGRFPENPPMQDWIALAQVRAIQEQTLVLERIAHLLTG